MRNIFPLNSFKRDWKRMKKRDVQRSQLEAIINLLAEDLDLPTRCRPHKLSGEWAGFWECHIKPDWLLIYDLDDPEYLKLVRTGSHADLFK